MFPCPVCDQAPNARGEPRPMAGATQERKLLGVGSTAMLGGRALELRVKKTQQGPAEIDDEQCLLLAEKLLVGMSKTCAVA